MGLAKTPGASAPAAAGPAPRFVTVPRLLLALIAIVLAWALREKYLVVAGILPLRGWALADFLRINLAYLAFLLVSSHLVLQSRRSLLAARAIAVALALHLATLDLANTEVIRFTGALAPSDVAFYMARAIDALPLSIVATELLTLVILPLLFLGAAVFGWRQMYAAPGRRRRALGFAAAAALLLAAAAAPPWAAGLELDKTRPSYLFHLAEYLARKTVLRPAPIDDPAFAARPALAPAGGARRAKKPNLVIVALESVGAGATSLDPSGPPGATPFLASLAASSWLAERAYAVIPHTSKALVAINCGRTPFPYHPIFESTLGIPGGCLAHLLGAEGYASAFFQAPTRHFENREGLVENLGFQHFVSGDRLDPASFQLANYFGYEEEILMAPSRAWLQGRGGHPFFAFYMTGSTHHPYWPPDRYGYQVFDPGNFERDSYLNSVRYLDHFVAGLIRQYRELGLYDDTVFVIVGDHGESLDRHHRLQHNASLYEEVLRVPLLIHAPALLPPARSAEIFSQLDLLPSLLALLGYTAGPLAEGISHFPPGSAPRPAAPAACFFEYWCAAIVDGRYKYIFNFDIKPEELYDLQQDPQELNNLAAREPAKAAALRRRATESYAAEIGRWHAFLSAKDPRYWSRREATLGTPAPLYKLPADDRRLHERRIGGPFGR